MYESLTQLINKLADDEYGTWIIDRESKGTIDDPIHVPFVDYSRAVTELERAIYGFVDEHKEYGLNMYADIMAANGIDWSWESMSKADISNADGKLIMALLVGALRADRFSEGTFLGFCEGGTVLRWLNRLQEIDAERIKNNNSFAGMTGV